MRENIIAIIVFLFLSTTLFGEKKAVEKKQQQKDQIGTLLVQSLYSDKIKIKDICFNKRGDNAGKGQVLEVEFKVQNKTEDAHDLYIFVIATFEKVEKTKSSFEMPIPEKEKIRNFVPFPDKKENYIYPHPKKKGIMKLFKFPKNPKAGINPNSGKPYHLENELMVRTYHLSKYRINYVFFNEVAILIFDRNSRVLFKQLYGISGVRR
ncbi:MAG: hypothetical protein SVR08_14730 [Spirochaetota bacterium]|nr:hypothetical protein [Spirochaetota bacterium]